MKRSLLSYMRKLRNHEFAEAYQLICNNLEVEESTTDNVAQAIDAAKGYIKNLGFLKNLKRQHPLTQQIKSLTANRHQHLISIRGRAAYYQRSPFAEKRNAANTILLWLTSYHEFLKRASIHAQSRMVSNMSEDIDTSKDIASAMVELELVTTFNSIKIGTEDIRIYYAIRKADQKADSDKAAGIRSTAYNHLSVLWKTTEVAIALGTGSEAECNAVLDGVNGVVGSFKAQYLSKTTRRENERLKDQENKNTPLDPAEV